MTASDHIHIGNADAPVGLALKYANRHGLVAGATGTGKTVTLQILAEGFARAGVPVFLADVKGDLAGLAAPGADRDFLRERAQRLGLTNYTGEAMPVTFWDLNGEKGHPIRATVTEMGPLLLARLLALNPTQEGVLSIAFRVADDEGLPLLDLKDLRALLAHVGERRAELGLSYGNIAPASVAAIQRSLLALEDQGADQFFGEPKIELSDFLRTTADGRGVINVLAADRLMMTPKLYATFLLWLLSELFEELPEIGDPDRPKLVFFFDEAHLLFEEAPKALLERIEQVVRLIRSKGVGVWFVTQNPQDIPDAVSGQLGNRVQHALRAYTPKEARVVKTAAETFRANPAFDAGTVIAELGIGEALVSMLGAKGIPNMVERTLICPPTSRLGPLTEAERAALLSASPMAARYGKTIDRESAYEILEGRAAKAAKDAADDAALAARRAEREARTAPRPEPSRAPARTGGRRRQTGIEQATNQAIRTGTNVLMRELVRGLLGGIKRRR